MTWREQFTVNASLNKKLVIKRKVKSFTPQFVITAPASSIDLLPSGESSEAVSIAESQD